MYQSHYENINVDVSSELNKYRELREKIRPMVIVVMNLMEIITDVDIRIYLF